MPLGANWVLEEAENFKELLKEVLAVVFQSKLSKIDQKNMKNAFLDGISKFIQF